MKHTQFVSITVIGFALSLAPAFAQAQNAAPAKSDSATTTSKKLKVLNNKNCPVSGHASGSMEKNAFVEYKGYKIGLCCNGCKEEFAKNPDAFLEKAKKEAKEKS